MSRTITSGGVTFMDLTDNRKLEAYITSNLPITQIYNQNSKTYTPDWSTTSLQLSADVFLDSKEVTDDTKTSIIWYKRIGTQSKTQVGTGVNLTVNGNQLTGSNGIITYICEATYNDTVTNPPTAHAEIVFTRVDAGLNGSNGQDGTGVTILGSYNTLAELQAAHPTGNAGDAYIIDGNLYVWAVDDSQWENVGNIQGPAGKDGQNAKSIILNGESQVFKVSKTNVVTPSTIKVTAYTFNTTVTNWTYSTNGGQTFLSTVPTGVSRNGNIVTVTGSTITSNSIVIKASDGQIEDVFTVYKAIDGSDGSKGNDGSPAPIAFLTNENVTFSANAQGQISGTTITSNVVAYTGATKVMPILRKNTDGTPAITGMPNGMSITTSEITSSNEIMLTITIANNSTLGSALNNMGVISIPVTYPVSTVLSLTWSKVNTGAVGATGNTGAPAYTAILTNESHVFAGDVSNAVDGSATTQVLAYKGTTTQTVTIFSVNGKTATTTDSDTGIAGLKFKCSSLSGTSPTITFTCTTSFISANGTIPIVFTVDGVSFTKMFTYSIAFKGATGTTGTPGSPGTPGTPATSYWLVSSASVVQKTSTGTITVTPSTLTFTGKSQTGVATPTDYACRWVIDVSTDGVTYTNISTSAANETSKAITVLTTYKTVRARMYMAGGTTVLLDEQIIPVVSDGAPGTSASLVDITPSALYFKSTTGKNGVFDPEYIYLYPRFQNVTYSRWEYSTDGGINWNAISSANGLLVVSHNSINNTLRISRTSNLYTDTITSVSFKCLTSNSAVYDIVSIAKIYDVVDLEIGGRNYIPNSEAVWSTPGIASNSAYGVYKTGLNSVYEQLIDRQLMISFEGMIETTDGNNGRIQVYGTNGNPKYRLTTISFANIIPNQWQKFSASVVVVPIEGNTGEGRIEFYGIDANVSKIHIKKLQLEVGNKVTDWSPAMEDLIEGASSTTVMLSNEAHVFESDLNGVAKPATIVLDVIGFKGATQTATTVGSITGIPSTGMAVSTSNNNTTNTKITIGVTSNLTSAIADYGVLTIPITVNGYTINKVFSWAKSNDMTGLQISGRNLLLNSGIPVTNAGYPTKTYNLATTPVVGDQYTITLKGTLGEGKTQFRAYNSGGSVSLGALTRVGTSDIYTLTFNWTNGALANPTAVHIYPLPASVTTTSTIEWVKLEKGNKATADWSPAPEDLKSTTFQLYAPKGYLITHDVPEVTLQTFAYDGSQPITNATFAWYSWSGEAWTTISGATGTSLTFNKASVLKSGVYKCEMTYGGKVYEATATVEDKTDIYDSLIRVNAKRTSNNSMYWVLYTTVYSEEGERDALLGPVSETAPASPTTGLYWYQINPTDYSVTLKKYSGTAWVTSTDKQELSYDWFLFKDTTEMVSLGDKSKVKIVKSGDFVTTCNVQCNVFDAENTVLSRNNQVLNDPTDPIVSETAPTNPIDGQIWIKVGANSSYMLSVWSAELNKWILSSADTQNKVYVTKPTQYNTGDLWIVDSNYSPVAYENGIVQDYKHPEKTMLMATATSQTYNDAHWVEALKYQKELNGVITDMEKFKQFISIDDTGLTMQAKGANGAVSEFKTMLTNTELGFYQGAARVAYINNNQLNISKAEITNGLTVSGTSPSLKIGNFTIIQETNGSLSIG